MHILFICRTFHNMAGGIEYSSTVFMNEMVRRGHNISLITWDHTTAEPFFKMDPAIDWHKLNLGHPTKRASHILRMGRALKMRKIIRSIKPDVMVGFHDDCFVMGRLASLGLGIPIIAAERNPPSRFDFSLHGTKKAVLNNLFRGARFVTVFFDRYHPLYPKYLKTKLVTIPNMIYKQETLAKPAGNDNETKTILYVARLAYQKNPQVLVKAFAQLSSEFPDWRVILLGHGPDKEDVETLIQKLDMASQIQIKSPVKDVANYYKAAQIFCFPSRWEGFGNALGEALSFGLPSVGFQECCGVRDLIQHNHSGILAKGMDNVDSLAEALRILMSNPNLRNEMGKNAAASIDKYEPKKVFDVWERVFKNAVA